MPVQNREIADLFDQVADLLEIQGANPFRVRAYRNAAQVVRTLPHALHELVEQGEDLSKLPGIGRDLASKITEIVQTGSLGLLQEIGKTVPLGLTEILKLPGLGPKRVRVLHEELGVRNIEDLARAARAGRLRDLPGFGEKTERAVLAAVQNQAASEQRMLWLEAEAVTRDLLAFLKRLQGVGRGEVAGSFRRKRETVGDLDILVTCRRGAAITKHFVAFEDVADVVSRGETRSTVILRSGLQVDLRVVPQVSYGAALQYFTGSKAHNIALRKLAVKKGLKINEYGVFRGKKRVAGRSEEEVYAAVGLPYIEPELREDRGEIEAAREGRLPELLRLEDIRGDLHVHTKASDGHASIEEMAEAGKRLGYSWLAITDHTKATRVAGGLDARAMRRHLRRIEEADQGIKGIRLLKSAEVDILEDGSLDLPDDLLAEMDIVVCAIHSGFGLSREKQTERILRAMDHPRFHVLAHPTGRLIGRREAYDVDLERVIAAAAERGCFLEVNAQPLRMDLSDIWCKAARDAGVKLALATDAHDPSHLEYMRLGVGQARRGWIEAGDVINSLTFGALKRRLRRA